MFCHLEIHWGALGRRNIAPGASHNFEFFFKLIISRSHVELQNPAHVHNEQDFEARRPILMKRV